MNTKFKVLAMLIGVSSIAYGATPSIEIQRKNNSKVFDLTYHGESKGTVKINVTDASGTVLAQRIVRNLRDFTIPVNFENQTSGKFIIKIDDANGSQSKEVSLEKNKTFYPLVTALKDNRYLVSVSNPLRESVRIDIFDEERTLVMTKETHADAAILFKLSKFKGQPVFEISRSTEN